MKANAHCKPDKLMLGFGRLTFLGHILSEDGSGEGEEHSRHADTEVQAGDKEVPGDGELLPVLDWQLLGAGDADIAPAEEQRTIRVVGRVREELQREMLRRLSSAPIMRHPDFSKELHLLCDASGTGIGGVLCQDDERMCAMVESWSRGLRGGEVNYPVVELEALAVVASVEHFRVYVTGTRFHVCSDQRSLMHISNSTRWRLRLSTNDFTLHCRAGILSVVADILSRRPWVNSAGEEEGDGTTGCGIDQAEGGPARQEHMVRPLGEKASREEERERSKDIDALGVPERRCMVKDGVVTEGKTERLWVPEGGWEEIFGAMHDTVAFGHQGRNRTLWWFSTRYSWKGINEDVAEWTRSGVKGEESKVRWNTRERGSLQRLNGYGPFEYVAMNHVDMPKNERGNLAVLTIIEVWSHWVEIVSIPGKTASTTAQALLNAWVMRFGCPVIIISDRVCLRRSTA